ncbi:MAG: hypothetical protein AAB505_00970 [Patescibacteria group bacterium]
MLCVCLVAVVTWLVFFYRDVFLVSGWMTSVVVITPLLAGAIFLVWLYFKLFGLIVARWLVKTERAKLENLLDTQNGRLAMTKLVAADPNLKLELEMVLGSRFLEKYPRDSL